MAENSEKREGYPDRKTAEAMLAEAEKSIRGLGAITAASRRMRRKKSLYPAA